MRKATWVAFVAMIIFSIVFGVNVGSNESVFMGVLTFVVGTFVSLLSVDGIMIFLDMAENIACIRYYTENDKYESKESKQTVSDLVK